MFKEFREFAVPGNVDFSDLFVVLREGAEPAPSLTLEAATATGAVTLNTASRRSPRPRRGARGARRS